MGKKILHPQTVTASDLLEMLSKEHLESIVDELDADKWLIKLGTKTVFSLLIYSLLESDRLSLRGMQENYGSAIFKAIENLAVDDRTAHSSIRDRLTQMNVKFFERVYEDVCRMVGKHYDELGLRRYNIKRYDSTMVQVCSHLMEGMKVGNTSKNKRLVKFTTELGNDFRVRMKFFSDQDHLSEETALKEVIQQVQHNKKDIIIFDRGLKSRQAFKEFTGAKTQFVLS